LITINLHQGYPVALLDTQLQQTVSQSVHTLVKLAKGVPFVLEDNGSFVGANGGSNIDKIRSIHAMPPKRYYLSLD
jgi:hypothetical protein